MSTLKVNNLQDLGADAVVTNGVIEKAALPSGTILQVVSTTKTGTYSEAITTGVSTNTVTGLTASITPSSTNSKVLVTVHGHFSSTVADGFGGFVIRRNGSIIGVGDAASSRSQVTGYAGAFDNEGNDMAQISMTFLDSPSDTSALTYAISLHCRANGTFYVNRTNTDTNVADIGRTVSTITVMEVAG
jgi:hypothetical protein